MENITIAIPVGAVSAIVSIVAIKLTDYLIRPKTKVANGNGKIRHIPLCPGPGNAKECRDHHDDIKMLRSDYNHMSRDMHEVKGDVKEILRRVK